MKTKMRKDCFFGLHSDFHAKPAENLAIGATLSESELREICEILRPDFMQVDCKGHPGWASYPTSMSNAMPEFKADPLKLFRRITREYSIALFVHFSGVYDIKYCLEHPEDAVMDAEGNYTSSVLPFSKYYDECFIPQISELVEKYEIDGVWVDGDCWSVKPDYRPETIAKFEAETGIDLGGKAPVTQDDPYFKEYLDYTREKFRECLRYYVDELHRRHPQLQVCSNWAFSDHMPEKVSAPVDFLSGDLNPGNSFNSARYAGRMLAQQNMPWDLMSWNLRYKTYDTSLVHSKHCIQILQEAAAVIALGGAYQDDVPQFPDASHDLVRVRNIAPLAKFMREREPYCFKGKAVHQAAMLVSTHDRYSEVRAPFSRDGMERLMGLTALLCDAGQSLELAGEHTLKDRYAEYPLIIVPELYAGLEAETIADLKAYAENGGSLLLIGAKTSRIFAENGFGFDAEDYDEIPEILGAFTCDNGHAFRQNVAQRSCYFSLCGDEYGVSVGACRITPHAGGKVFGMLHNSMRSEGAPFAVEFGFGKGKIAVIGMDLGTQYHQAKQYLHRNLIKAVAAELYDPLARIESACGMLEIVCLEKDGRLLLQLVNANGDHSNPNCATEDMIPPVLEIHLSVRADAPPQTLLLQPENKALDFEYRDGRIYFSVDRVNIHDIVEIRL